MCIYIYINSSITSFGSITFEVLRIENFNRRVYLWPAQLENYAHHESVVLLFLFTNVHFTGKIILDQKVFSSKKSVHHHDDVIKWKHFPRYWPFVRGIHRSQVNSPHKGQWRGALMFSLICAWIKVWVNNRKAGDLGPNRAHYDVSVMISFCFWLCGLFAI